MDLSGANLTEANFKNANFEYAVLIKANFRGANLKNTKFDYADVRYADFRETNLNSSQLSSTVYQGYGAKLPIPAKRICSNCGEVMMARDGNFCSHCGHNMHKQLQM
jgi:uncharacterized protein YjbI with pentapeptide repeats